MYQRPSQGGNPGNIRRHGTGLSTLFVYFKPRMGGLDCFCTFVAGFLGEDPQDL